MVGMCRESFWTREVIWGDVREKVISRAVMWSFEGGMIQRSGFGEGWEVSFFFFFFGCGCLKFWGRELTRRDGEELVLDFCDEVLYSGGWTSPEYETVPLVFEVGVLGGVY